MSQHVAVMVCIGAGVWTLGAFMLGAVMGKMIKSQAPIIIRLD